MSSSESFDEGECDFEYWNDWQPPAVDSASSSTINDNKKKTKVVFDNNTEKFKYVSSTVNNDKFGNWIPPLNFSRENKKMLTSRELKSKSLVKSKVESNCTVETVKKNESDHHKNFTEKNDQISLYKNLNLERILNSDWGERIELHDVTRFCEGDSMWGVVTLGVFASIKLWVNEYGNVCGSAEGRISKESSRESTLISISNTLHLRKMLMITSTQWSSVCEIVRENKMTLKFEALTSYNLKNMNSLEKLWFYICKRRHFLPDQCMLVKLSGAKKSLEDFEIIPKLIVQEIRDINGLPIP